MRVTFDISKLASDWDSQKRTGIGRVVEHLAVELFRSPACELTFCCMKTSFARAARRGTRAHPQLARVPIPFAWHRRALRVARERTGSTPATLARAFARAEALWGLEAHAIEPRVLAQTEIFHSPMHPLPPVKLPPTAQRFLTIYDLIPVRHPEFFDVPNRAEVQALIRGIVDSALPHDWIICPSQATLDDLQDYCERAIERAFVIPLAADRHLFHPRSSEDDIRAVRKKYGVPDGAYFLSVCKLEPRKNGAHMARAFLQMVTQQKLRDVTLVLAGTPAWGASEIQAAVESFPDAQSRKQVLFAGHVADEDLAALYRGAHAFLYLSFVEGFGLPPLEAMQCGAPVIVADCSSLPEVVGDAGVLLAPRDSDGLASALLTLYNDSSLRRAYAEKSLARAAFFSWQRCAQETLGAYRQSLGLESPPQYREIVVNCEL